MRNEESPPVVLLLGRPNVGKSTLFNKLLSKRVAITDAVPHTTRDVLAMSCSYRGLTFLLQDCAGFLTRADDSLLESVRRGLDRAVGNADLLVLVFDGKTGLTPADAEIASYARRSGKAVLPVINKVDGNTRDDAVVDFFELGFDNDPLPVSAKGGYNCLELLDAIHDALGEGRLREDAEEQEGTRAIRVAVLGRPNVGKSSLLNHLAGGERVVVDSRPGTTRDAVDVEINHEGQPYLFVDTAGIRRQTRAKTPVEEWSLAKAFDTVGRVDVVVLVTDGAEGPTSQDAKLASYADYKGKALIIFVNKTDLLPADVAVDVGITRIREELRFAPYAMALAGSALTGQGVELLYGAIREAFASNRFRVGTGELNRMIKSASQRRVFYARGKEVRVRYAAQVEMAPPLFHIFLNVNELPPPEFERFVENRIREAFPLAGTPIRLVFRLRRGREDK